MIHVFEPSIDENEINAVVKALKAGEISGSFGKSIPLFEQNIADYCGSKYAVAVNSGTSSLILAVATCIKKGDEVLISASTNIATALAVIHNGGIPIPIDSENDTWNLNLDLIEQYITPKTKAIIAVHIFGHPVNIPKLKKIADQYNLSIIEDCAESLGATCFSKQTGTLGDIGCFSFYANKTITTGEGGMLITDDENLYEKLKLLRNLAFTTPRFIHHYAGYNFRMTGYQAAMGIAQMQKINNIVKKKRLIANTYSKFLKDIPALKLPVELSWARNIYWMYALEVKKDFKVNRNQLMTILAENGIETRTFFCPMNKQPVLKQIDGFHSTPCPVAERIWETGLYLPSSLNLTEEIIFNISDIIKKALT